MDRKILIGIVVAAVLVVVLIIAIAVPLSMGGDDENERVDTSGLPPLERAKIILGRVPLVDGHNDLSWQYRERTKNQVYTINLESDVNTQDGWKDEKGNVPGHTDIPKLREGMVGAQFWACFVHCNTSTTDAVRVSLDQLDTIKKFVHRYPKDFQWVTTAQGIWDAFNAGKIGSMVGLEGGHSIDSSLSTLRMFYDLGVRYMTITHSCNTPWADNWSEDHDGNINNGTLGGLTAFGETVIKEMNRIGMFVDLSHVSWQTMEDAFRVTKAPAIFSHSSAWHLCNHSRNVRNDMLDKTHGLNFWESCVESVCTMWNCPSYTSMAFNGEIHHTEIISSSVFTAHQRSCWEKENNGVVMVNFYDKYIICGNDSSTATLSDVADHIDYIKNQIGVDYVGIGADYDGVPTLPKGLEDISKYPDLFAELASRGWTDEEMEKLAGLNLIRAFRKIEEVRDSMANLPPYEELIPENEIPDEFSQCRPDF